MAPSIFHELITLLNKTEEGLDNQNFEILEEHSTKALRTLKDIETKIQFLRVKAYLQRGNFNKARAIVQSIQKTPSIQEDSVQFIGMLMKKEKYVEVIEMCDVLKQVKENQGQLQNEEESDEIAELRQKAVDKIEIRDQIDIMTKLPFDIRTLILDQLDLIDISNGIHVSKSWRKNICDSSATSRQNVILHHEMKEKTESLFSPFFKYSIGLLSNGVKRLQISTPSSWDNEEIKALIDISTSVSFNNLRVLTIETEFIPQFPIEQAKRLLQSSCHSLEEVYIYGITLGCNEVLDICPNLKRLELREQYSTHHEPPKRLKQSSSQYPSLTYLHVSTQVEYETEFYEETLKRLTHLQKVSFQSVKFNWTFLELLCQHGSKELRHISINAPPDQYSQYMKNEDDNCTIDTSRYDYVVDVHRCPNMTATLLLQLVNHSVNMKQKIEAILLSPERSSGLDNWSPFQYFTAPCLQYIQFSFNKATEVAFANVIRNCPALEIINIFPLIETPSNIIMGAIKTLPVLRSFTVQNSSYDLYDHLHNRRYITDFNDTAIRDFFTHHALLDKHSTLQHVSLRYISSLEPETLEMLFKIKNLKSLNFADDELINGQSFYSVINGPDGSLLPNQLEILVLEDIGITTDNDVQFLDFSTIKLLMLDGLTTAGLKGMVKNSKRLKKLVVDLCDQKYIQDNIPAEIGDFMKRNNIQFN
ncbi:hypothetical protein INT45_008853 [Circinella minor]|uniref:F-box domain-containing protein n=1 Tax=Circinella minor TaxID=1195481 RepID=A0A8H7RWK3_9FUNG|nr:hypothetical protein INT45_008853 [Circinella minor]